MIKGIGVDIVDLERLSIDNEFYKKILTINEQKIFESLPNTQKREYLGGRFAGKEAYSKALQCGIGKIGFHDIEILNDEFGAPIINKEDTHISISHEKKYAIAFVVIDQK